MDIHQARTRVHSKRNYKLDIHQEKLEASVHSVWPKLKETIKHQMEDVLSCVNQQTHGLCKELIEKIYETRTCRL